MINIHTIESPKNALHFLYMILLQCSVNADKNKNKMRKSQYCVSRKKHRGRLAMPNIRVTKSNCQVSRSKATNKITKKKNQNKNENEKKIYIWILNINISSRQLFSIQHWVGRKHSNFIDAGFSFLLSLSPSCLHSHLTAINNATIRK